jgi:hypothetical protein
LRVLGILFLAAALAMAPVVLMGRDGTLYEMETRYWLPLLPVAACLNVLLVRTLGRARLTPVVVTILALGCFYAAVTTAGTEWRNVRAAEDLGAFLHSVMTPQGYNEAYIVYDSPDNRRAYSSELSYELTARITEGWPARDRNRFWAWTGAPYNDRLPFPAADLSVVLRGTLRYGAVAKSFWINVDGDGRIRRILQWTPETGGWFPPG